MLKTWLLMSVFTMRAIDAHDQFTRLCSMSGAPDAGGAAPADGGGGGGDGGGNPLNPPSALSAAVDPDKAKPAADPDKPAGADDATKDKETPAETPEQKAERLKNETPEEKTAREAKEKEDADKKTADVLKTYDAIKLPQGITKELPAVKDFLAAAAKDGMPVEKAQAYVDSVAPKLQAAVEAPYKAWADMQAQWISDLKTDKVVGGADLEKNLGFCAKAIDAYGADDAQAVREAFEFTGAGNNPAIVRMMYRAGKALAEGGPLPSKGGTQVDLAEAMYPSMTKG